MLKAIARGLLDLLIPPRCALCGAFPGPADGDLSSVGVGFCQTCLAGMPPLPPSRCQLCGRPFASPVDSIHLCGFCRQKPPAYRRAVATGLYEGALAEAIHRFKYSGRTEMAKPLALVMAGRLEAPFRPPAVDLILPVPLHVSRLKERGFNQSLLLARSLFKPWSNLIRHDLLLRSRATKPQVSLKGIERQKNVKRAFSLSDPSQVQDRSIMIIDDVFTTGATISECARVLRKAGATEVLVLTLARVP